MKKAQNMPYQSRTLGAEAWYRFKKNKLALGALAIFILLALMAITTIIIDLVTNNSIYDKYVISQDLLQRLQPPSKEQLSMTPSSLSVMWMLREQVPRVLYEISMGFNLRCMDGMAFTGPARRARAARSQGPCARSGRTRCPRGRRPCRPAER